MRVDDLTVTVKIDTQPAVATSAAQAATEAAKNAAAKPRQWILRIAKQVRHLELVARAMSRLDALASTLLLTKRPRWVDKVIIGGRAAAALSDELDARVHSEITRGGIPIWPCTGLIAPALQPYYRGTYFKGMHWYALPQGKRKIDVVLSTSGTPQIYVDGDASCVLDVMWQHYAGLMDIRVDSGEAEGVAGKPLLAGHQSPITTRLLAEIESGQRSAVLLLGAPGVGKSYIAEQIAAAYSATRAGGRVQRVMRIPEAANVTTSRMRGVLEFCRPDVVVVHDLDTDTPSKAVVLRVAEMCQELGVLLVCTINSKDNLHDATFGDHRLGQPVVIDRAPTEVVRAVLGDACATLDAASTEDQERVAAMPLASIVKMRKRLAAGGPMLEPIVTAPTS